MKLRIASALFVALAAFAGAAQPSVAQVTPTAPSSRVPEATTSPAAPQATPPAATTPPAAVQQPGNLQVVAILGGQAGLIRSGIVWRIFRDSGDEPVLVQTSEAPAPSFKLEPGVYFIHATYGLASATRRVALGASPITKSLTINAGGLVLGGIIGDAQIAPERLRFSVFVPVGNDPEGRVVVQDARGGELIRLPEGTYRVVSSYGDSNAITSADLKVEAGKVTEATMRHKAATITLKLVTASGSEALAATSFSVLTPGGDTIREAIGAFPSMTLAEGEYIVIARNGGKVFTQEFQVKSGYDRDIEVIVK